MIDIPHLIEQTNRLQPPPANTLRLVDLVCDSDCDLTEVSELVNYDQVLTMKLLRTANSAVSATALPVSNVHEAVQRMGAMQVMAFAVASAARPHFQGSLPGYGLNEGALWRHSVAAAVAIETLQACGVAVPAYASTAALLHDIGKLVLGRFLSPEILGFIERAHEHDGLTQIQAESTLLGVHHGELGGLIAQHWKLPPAVVSGITWHHDPGAGGESVCDLTYLANLLAKQIESDLDGRQYDLKIDPKVADRLELEQDKLESFGPRAVERYAQVCHRYDVF